MAAALSAALIGGPVGESVQAAATAPAHDAGAVAAKKKKKRKKKCRREGQSPLANALSCTRLIRSIPNEPPTASGTERYDFCRNGTYGYLKGSVGSEGKSFTTTYRGRWKVISSTSNSSGVSGAIQYTVTDYRSVFFDGMPAETPPPSLLSEAIAFGPFGVDFGGRTFLRGKAPC